MFTDSATYTCINNHSLFLIVYSLFILKNVQEIFVAEIMCIFSIVFSSLNGTTRNHTKENRQLRRQSSSESDDSEKKRLKTVC